MMGGAVVVGSGHPLVLLTFLVGLRGLREGFAGPEDAQCLADGRVVLVEILQPCLSILLISFKPES